MMRILCLLMLCTVCVACDDDTSTLDASAGHGDGDGDGDGDGGSTACANRYPELCEQDADCSVIGGREAGDDFEGSVDDDIPLGCQSRDTGCGDAVTCAYNGENGPAYRFRTTCIPLGWLMLDNTECAYANASPPCSTRSVDECDPEACDVLTAQPVGDDDGAFEPIACTVKGRSCDDALTCGASPDDELYVFPDSCLPSGFSEVGFSACDDGASSADAGLDCVKGEYVAFFVAISGNCGPISTSFHVSLGETGVRTTTEMFASTEVTTTTVVEGCSARVALTVAAKTGQVTEQIDAPVLEPEGGGSLAGVASRVRFGDQSQVLCEGTYEMTLIPRPPLP